jgi:RNA polymerase sigma-70 factor, ECF subfamily
VDELDALARAAAAGDRRALERFVTSTEGEVWRYCAWLIGADDAADATQETYLAAWRAIGRFRHESSARTWLFVIARRCALRLGERHGRWRELAALEPSGRRTSGLGEGSEVAELLAMLDPDRRSAFVLTQLLGFSYAETAEIEHCAIGTIRSRVARARAELAQRWTNEEHLSQEG